MLNELRRKHLYTKVERGCKRKRTFEEHAAALLNGIPLSGYLYVPADSAAKLQTHEVHSVFSLHQPRLMKFER